jgi:hypothetical protein
MMKSYMSIDNINEFEVESLIGKDKEEELAKQRERMRGYSPICFGLVFSFMIVTLVFLEVANVFNKWHANKDDQTDDATTNDDVSSSTTRPNIVFIVADDLGYNSIGYQTFDLNGYTPFLSKLLKQGIFLDNYYAQEECTPSRASMLTGRYPIKLGMQYQVVQPEYD